MTVLAIQHNVQIGSGDLAPPFLAQLHRPEFALETLVYTVLMTNARISDDEQERYKLATAGGYWGDMFESESFGSLLWTLKRALNTPETWERARGYAANSLRRWIGTDIVRTFLVEAGRASSDALYLRIIATLPDGKTHEILKEVPVNAA